MHWHDFEFYVQDTWKVKRNVTLSYGFRWSFYREPYGGDNHWANWNFNNWSASEAVANPSDACNGAVIVPHTTPCADATKFLAGLGVNLPSLLRNPRQEQRFDRQQQSQYCAPAWAIAWDVYGNGKTALRFGGGQFFQRELVGIDEGMARTAPFVINVNTNRALDTPAPLANPSVSPNYGKKPARRLLLMPGRWNATVEQEVARNTTIEIGYVGNTGVPPDLDV